MREAANITDAIVEAVQSLGSHHRGAVLSWKHEGSIMYAAVVFLDDDETVEDPDTGERCKREAWQRKNLLMAMGTDAREVAFHARNATLASSRLTVWFDRVRSQYHVGPLGERMGASGRPEWADRVCAGLSPYG